MFTCSREAHGQFRQPSAGGSESAHLADDYLPCELRFCVRPLQGPLVGLASETANLYIPGLLLFCLVFFFFTPSPVSALGTSWQISQYGHTAWRIEDGVFAGPPNVMAQTTDGYLWIGTQAGLMRFDGVRFVAWKPPEGNELPSSRINSLLGARDGSLWIGTTMGLARWRSGNLTHYTDPPGSIMEIMEDRAGTIWIARANISDAKGPLCRVTDTGLQCYGRDDGLVIPFAVTLANDSVGNLWLAGGALVSRWQSNSADTYVPAGLNPAEVFNGVLALAGGPDGSIWVGFVYAGKGGGLQQLAQGTWRPFITSEFDSSTLRVTRLLVDRLGSLWIGTLDQGIYRLQGNQVDHFRSSDGLSGDAVSGLFEDREGNIWIATSRGIDNFHDLRVASFSTRQGLSADQVNSVVASRDGTVWIGNYNLDALRLGKITSIQPRNGLPGRELTSLLEDRAGRLWVGVDQELSVYEHGRFRKISNRNGIPLGAVRAMAEDIDGSIWAVTSAMSSKTYRLFRVTDFEIREEISTPQLPPTIGVAPDLRGGVWLALMSGGLGRYRNGQLELINFSGSPQAGPVHGLLVNSDGSVLAATPSGVVGWQNGKLQTLTVRNGLPCDVVYSLIADKNRTLWLYAACGLIAIPQAELEAWWQSPERIVSFKLLDVFDGALAMSTSFRPNASLSPDGRLWFANQNVVQMIDPAHLEGNPIPPPVHVEEVSADRKTYAPLDGLRLPALTRDLRIDYTALSFVAPQKVRFRYKLEGHDSEWQDAGTRRQAFYTDLGPGNYRFRVIACNNDGIWNEEGTTLAFSVAPAWYQTWWLRGICVVGFAALLWGLHQLRVRHLQHQEKKLRDVIETVPALAFSTSPDGSNQWVNRRWVEYSGLSPEATSGSGWRSVVHPDDLETHMKRWQSSLASGEPFENEARHRSASGEYRWFLVRGVPLRDEQGRILRWYGTLTDIEDRKHAEEERQRLHRLQFELAHINRVSTMGELAASIAHELKQPIAAAITNASAVIRWLKRDQPNVAEACRTTTRIIEDGTRASEIIDRLQSLYKKLPPERELVDVNEIISQMVVLLRSEASSCAVSLRTQLGADLPKATADRVQLQQVLMNLMLNGIEAMKETGGWLKVTSQLGEQGQLLISVSDNGIGLPGDKADQIFNSFFSTKPQGSGMGLAISRSIIEAHDGRLWATANEGRGASFHFTLPSEAVTPSRAD